MAIVDLKVLAKTSLKTKKVPTPEFGEDMFVVIRELSGNGMASLMTASEDGNLTEDGVRKLFKNSIAKEDGSLMFTKGEEVVTFLDSISNDLCQRLLKEITEFNKLGKVEETAKN